MRVWTVGLDLDEATLTQLEELLTDAERARAQRSRADVRRRRIALRAAVRAAAGEVLGMAPQDVPLTLSPWGRPLVEGIGPGPRVDVNCSASGRVGVVAVAVGRRVGVDVEEHRAWSAGTPDEDWLSPREIDVLTQIPVHHRGVLSTRCWTKKEAFLKGLGTGLRQDPAGVLTDVRRSDDAIAGWELCPVAVPDGYVATLAVGPPAPSGLPRSRTGEDAP